MVELIERRVTRSLSNELQARASAAQAQAQSQNHSQNQYSVVNPPSQTKRITEGLGNGAEADLLAFQSSPYRRTTSEEILIRTLVDGAMVPAISSMECLGLSNLPQVPRMNSEDLFSTWISNTDGEEVGVSTLQERQSPGRMSTRFGTIMYEPHGMHHQQLKEYEENTLPLTSFFSDNMFGDQLKQRNESGQRMTTIPDLSTLQVLPWSQDCKPMTRSRSSELRRKYLTIQGPSLPPTADTLQKLATQGTRELNQAVASLGAFTRNLANGKIPQPSPQSMQPPLSVSPAPLEGTGSPVSWMVSMLKGSLESKKSSDQILHQEDHVRVSSPYRLALEGHDRPQSHTAYLKYANVESQSQAGGQLSTGTFVSNGLSRSSLLANTPSPSESSGGVPTISAGLEISDGPSTSGTVSNQEKNLKRVLQGCGTVDQPANRGYFHSTSSHGPGEVQIEGSQKATLCKKPVNLTRAGSLTSSGRSGLGVDTSNPTKMRRVERREKMLEAKVRPVVPSDLQAVVKRCDTLEKEVRSLKLTVSFMNRKDSEQTKRIEELEKENQELLQDKQRLLEEIERLLSG